LDGLRGEDSIAELCRREGISQGIYYKWSKDFMEAGKRRLAGDTARAANTDEVKVLRREARDLDLRPKYPPACWRVLGFDLMVLCGQFVHAHFLCKNSIGVRFPSDECGL